MDLAPPRTLQVVLPSRREANFQDFALVLLHRFFINSRVHFRRILAPFSLQDRFNMAFKTWTKNAQILMYFFIDFYPILASILEPIFLQNRSKRGDRIKHHHTFYYFRFWSPLCGTPWLWFLRFSTQSGRILRPFLSVFWTVSQLFRYISSYKLALFFVMNLAAGCWLAGGWWGGAKRKEFNIFWK